MPSARSKPKKAVQASEEPPRHLPALPAHSEQVCAHAAKLVSHLHTPLAARSRPRDRSRSQIHISAQCAARPARPACAVTPRWHGPPAGAGLCVRLGWECLSGVQMTMDGGVITPPSNVIVPPAAIAAVASGAAASGAVASGAAACQLGRRHLGRCLGCRRASARRNLPRSYSVPEDITRPHARW